MGFMDKVKDTLGKNAEKVDGGIDKGGDMVDDKTGHKHSDQIDKGADRAKDALNKLDDDKK